jgi:hypothetical protein
MVDFSKFKIPKEKFLYVYRCKKCKKEIAYVVEMPQSMLKHKGIGEEVYDPKSERYRQCYGILEFVKKELDK